MSQFAIHKPHYDQIVYWIIERENIRRKKETGQPAPWTKDARMANTRWCNVRRMDDKVSRWLLENFYTNRRLVPSEMAVGASLARLINRPETLELLCRDGYEGFHYKNFYAALANMAKSGQQIFTGVYIINGAGANGRKKWQLVIDNLRDMWNSISDEEIDTTSMENTHRNLMQYAGLGSFIAGQVVADLRHVVKGTWADKDAWAPQGPGSTRGLAYALNVRPKEITKRAWPEAFNVYSNALRNDRRLAKIFADRKLEAHDLQNTLCEGSKWARVLEGGRSKNRYKASGDAANQLTLL